MEVQKLYPVNGQIAQERINGSELTEKVTYEKDKIEHKNQILENGRTLTLHFCYVMRKCKLSSKF